MVYRVDHTFVYTFNSPLKEVVKDLQSEERRSLIDYIHCVCDRVDEIEPKIRALVDESDRRGRLVREAEELLRDGSNDRPLFGVPVGVKDIIHTDGFTTRAGTALPPELFQGPESPIVTALREAGALILGKTVTTEFAGSAPGLTRNPHDIDHTPGGSSSGSAAATAAGLCPLAIGTQTGGSVLRPAAFCGIIGFKPSYGRIPMKGVLPRSKSVDTVGLFTQDILGMNIAAQIICNEWSEPDISERPILGIPVGPYLERASQEARQVLDCQQEALIDAGYDVQEISLFDDFTSIEKLHRDLTGAELALVHSTWLEEYEPFYRSSTASRIREGAAVTTGRLARSRAGRFEIRAFIEERMDEAGIDILICPSAPGTAPKGLSNTGDQVMNVPWTYAGLPAVSLPAGTIRGLPVGLQCVTRFGADEKLLEWTQQLHKINKGRFYDSIV